MFQSKRKRVGPYIAMLILAICCYLGIYHSHRYFGFNWIIWLGALAVFTMVYLCDLWFDIAGRWYKLKSVLIVLFVGGPVAVFVFKMHESFMEKQLAKYGVPAEGIVTKLYLQRNRNSQTPYAIFNYTLNNKIWTQEVINTNSAIQVGDTLKLRCAKTDPEIFRIE